MLAFNAFWLEVASGQSTSPKPASSQSQDVPLVKRTLTAAEEQKFNADAIRINQQTVKYLKEGKLPEAIRSMQEFLSLGERIYGPDHPGIVTTLENLATLYLRQNDFDSAEKQYQRAFLITEKAFGENDPRTGRTLNNLAYHYLSRGKYSEAEPRFQRTLQICETAFGADHPNTAATLNNLASVYDAQGKYLAAEPLYERSLKIRETALGPDDQAVAESLNNLAFLYGNQGRHAEAEPLYLRALKITESKLGADHPDNGRSHNNLGFLYDTQGNYVDAERFYLKALKIVEAAQGPEHPTVAATLNNLAELYASIGNFEKAEPLYRRSLAIRQKAFGANHRDTAESLNNLATYHARRNDQVAAQSYYEQAISIYTALLGPDHPSTARAGNNLAVCFARQGKTESAIEWCEKSLQTREKVLGPYHPDVAESLNNLASLYGAQGQGAKAIPLYRRAVEILENSVGPNHPGMAGSCLTNLASSLAQQGSLDEAFATMDRVRHIIRHHVVRILPALTEKEQTAFLANQHTNGLALSLSLALDHASKPSVANQSAAWVLNAKGVAQESLAQTHLLSRDIDSPKVAELVQELIQIRSKIASLAMAIPDKEQRVARDQSIASLTNKDERLQAELRSAGLPLDQPTVAWIELDQLRSQLSPRSVFIDFSRFRYVDIHEKDPGKRWQGEHYVAWVSTPTGDAVMIDLGATEPIDALIKSLQQTIAQASGESGTIAQLGEEVATLQWMKAAETLAEKIWFPLLPHLSNAQELILSPDSALWLVPWSALPLANDQQKFVAEQYSVRYVNSGRDVMVKSSDFQPTAPVVFADPSFDQSAEKKASSLRAIFKSISTEDDFASRGFMSKALLPKVTPLPNTAVEAMTIKPSIEQYTQNKAIMYQEQFALEHVAKALQRPRLATFATHGFFLPQQRMPDRQGVELLPLKNTADHFDGSGKPLENPLLRCGLLLAGCNDRESVVGNDDGILTGKEITGIDFRGTELVVLSACETGLGDVKNGEGVAGLRQSFQLAGAQSVVATLWQVPDRDSALMMGQFFEQIAKGTARSTALQLAQRDRIEKRRDRNGAAHPFFWAAYTLTGQ